VTKLTRSFCCPTIHHRPALEAPTECARSICISYVPPTAAASGYPSEGELELIRADLK
jgi:hypothetical protein